MCSVRLGLLRREVKIAELDMDNNIRNFLVVIFRANAYYKGVSMILF